MLDNQFWKDKPRSDPEKLHAGQMKSITVHAIANNGLTWVLLDATGFPRNPGGSHPWMLRGFRQEQALQTVCIMSHLTHCLLPSFHCKAAGDSSKSLFASISTAKERRSKQPIMSSEVNETGAHQIMSTCSVSVLSELVRAPCQAASGLGPKHAHTMPSVTTARIPFVAKISSETKKQPACKPSMTVLLTHGDASDVRTTSAFNTKSGTMSDKQRWASCHPSSPVKYIDLTRHNCAHHGGPRKMLTVAQVLGEGRKSFCMLQSGNSSTGT